MGTTPGMTAAALPTMLGTSVGTTAAVTADKTFGTSEGTTPPATADRTLGTSVATMPGRAVTSDTTADTTLGTSVATTLGRRPTAVSTAGTTEGRTPPTTLTGLPTARLASRRVSTRVVIVGVMAVMVVPSSPAIIQERVEMMVAAFWGVAHCPMTAGTVTTQLTASRRAACAWKTVPPTEISAIVKPLVRGSIPPATISDRLVSSAARTSGEAVHVDIALELPLTVH